MPHFLIMRHVNLALLSLKELLISGAPQSYMLCIEDQSGPPLEGLQIGCRRGAYKTNLSIGLAYPYNPNFASTPLGLVLDGINCRQSHKRIHPRGHPVFYAEHRRPTLKGCRGGTYKTG
jgi:hypothetical protein